jgi:Zn-dependent peptidase ImmA (M78 family)
MAGNPLANSADSYAPEALLEQLGIRRPQDIDVEIIAQYCGATVTYEPLTACEARVLGLGDRAIITVNSESIGSRQRFSTAHELAHWVRDRGKMAAACTDRTIRSSWGTDRESRANEYASDLLLPKSMFISRVKGREITFVTVDALRDEFNTSMTATAIRLVRYGPYPSMVVCLGPSGREWFVASSEIERRLWPRKVPGKNTVAHELLQGGQVADRPQDVDSDAWIDRDDADEYVVREHSRRISNGRVLSLLWWKDQRQVNALDK